ncbi:helix-turn-helix transcriptional regulator [Terrabacter terrigena]|uniref:LuxR C-terminal-related transcriptional regulator n=1 Tax=Terrabacter terrigena TaxID=574718 RepID=A0ABW3MZI0_9MICO
MLGEAAHDVRSHLDLVGRKRERAVLDRLLGATDGENGVVLVVHGEPGVGKTALLDYAAVAGQGFRVARTSGVEGEMELPFAALQQLCSPVLDLRERLPRPQRDALNVAFGLNAGAAPSPFLVGLATLGLLSEAAKDTPLVVIVDDAQWLDAGSQRALAFVAHRLFAERIALLFGTRQPSGGLTRLPELHVEPLGRRDANALLVSVLPAPLDDSVLDRVVAETRGNPLALLELPRGLTPTQLAGGFGLPANVPLSASIEVSFTRRLSSLPRDDRRLLLVAAADPVGDPELVRRAARYLGVPDTTVGVLESQGLLVFAPRVVFRHPLVRSAVYRAAGLHERRDVHQALAAATDPDLDPDRRAWHRAQGTATPDEEIATELERSAARAQARGGLAAAAAFLERAATLTPEPSRRATRALTAAETKVQAGALEDASQLLASAEATGSLNEFELARANLSRAQIAFVATHGSDAPALLLEAAGRLSTLDPSLARQTYLDALSAALFAGRLAQPGARALEVAQAARTAPAPTLKGRGPDLLLDALTTLLSGSYTEAAPRLRRAVNAFGTDKFAAEQIRWMWLATIASVQLWDDAEWETLSERHIRIARTTGALGDLPLALTQRIYLHLLSGELEAAASLVAEIQRVTDTTGSDLAPYGAVGLAAFRGDQAEASYLIERTRVEVRSRGEGIGLSVLDWATATLNNGLGRYEEALEAAQRVAPRDLNPSMWIMAELIEAAVRAGTPEAAGAAQSRLASIAEATGTDWAAGIASRSAALIAEGPSAEALYAAAVNRLGRTRIAVDLARARLLYGEWLRRERRRMDARAELRAAYELFSDFGMEAFAERARIELLATGEHARSRTVDISEQLTPREAQIAHLAAKGSTNREIASQLFISPNTVEYHLRKVFRKLEVKSRTQLGSRIS